MNRHERRVAEAKIRRRGVGTPLDEIDKGAMMIGARSAIPDDIKADIARVVCAIWFPLIAGQACYIRSAIGYRVLTMLGFEPEGKIGGLLFRAGPDPRRDVVAFCGKENHGSMHQGQFLGHIWLSLDGETIDFTGCEWKHMSAPADGLGPVQWRCAPPALVWAPEEAFGWASEGEPDIGQVWYCPWRGELPEIGCVI